MLLAATASARKRRAAQLPSAAEEEPLSRTPLAGHSLPAARDDDEDGCASGLWPPAPATYGRRGAGTSSRKMLVFAGAAPQSEPRAARGANARLRSPALLPSKVALATSPSRSPSPRAAATRAAAVALDDVPEAEEEAGAETAPAAKHKRSTIEFDERAFKHAAAMRMLRGASGNLLKLKRDATGRDES